MPTFRIERINRELLRRISDLIRTRIKDDSLREAVLSEVVCSKDLSHAKVYFRTLTPGSREKVEASLNKTAGVLRSMLGKGMRLRQVPELHFVYDTTEDRAQAIENILDSLGLPGAVREGEDAGS